MARDAKAFSTVEEAVAEIRAGKMIVVVDDEDRENEGDLTMAAEFCTPEAVNFRTRADLPDPDGRAGGLPAAAADVD